MSAEVRTRRLVVAGIAAFATGLSLAPGAAGAAPSSQGAGSAESATYVVLFAEGTRTGAGVDAVRRAGGAVLALNESLGTASVQAPAEGFVTAVSSQAGIAGATHDRRIGTASPDRRPSRADVERLAAERAASRGQGGKAPAPGVPAPEPLSPLQWDMQMIRATPAGSYAVQRGDHRVLVGILDTGVDGTHPDIAPNFSAALSRNFVTDKVDIDGPCEHAGCVDPVDEDGDGHGTHVAGTIGSPINGIGIAGVAPDVTLVNIRAGQDSGYFFLQPTLDALTYAGDIGVDVVNMSYYIDPWLYNCRDNPADSPEAQIEQRTIIDATQRALDYAHKRGVTLVAAEGNGHTDLGNPVFDDTSPDYPLGAAYERDVDNTCLNLPTEGDHVVGVTSVGPSGRKAYYSDYGLEQADVAAPGGDFRDFPGTDRYRTPENLVLAPYPAALAEANGDLNADGTPNNPFVVQDGGAYYQYLQGTSMASPHAAGVAALIVSQYGVADGRNKGGLTLKPVQTAKILQATATESPCPTPRTYVYPQLPADFTATCEGTTAHNGFFGTGVVDALAAVTSRR